MAIDSHQWAMIVEAGCKGRALSAGYPDLLLTKQEIAAAIKEGEGEIKERKDSWKVQKHHQYLGHIYDSHDVFAAIGLELDVIDRTQIIGCERIVDLNEGNLYTHAPDLGYYDLVIDPGTSEHCFNIAQALVNLADAVKIGGVISHGLPMSMFNHGYWNVNPIALVDFYETNGFKIEQLILRCPKGIFEPKPEDRGRRLKGVEEDSVVLLTARRLEQREFVWPQQKITSSPC